MARTWPRRGGWRCGRRCSGARARTVILHRCAVPVGWAGGDRQLRTRARQRRRLAERLGFAAQVVQRLTRCYWCCPKLGWGDVKILDQPHPAVIVQQTSWDDGHLVTVHNLSGDPLVLPLQLEDLAARSSSSTFSRTEPSTSTLGPAA